MTRTLMIHTVRPGDLLTMNGPDDEWSDPFILADFPAVDGDHVWLYREYDAPIVVERRYGLDSTFTLHHRASELVGRHRAD